ncbi:MULTISPECIES: hypothetical protein [Salinivibrio]|nr:MULTISPECIES: hypothetical protein [Salinivibrio]
MDTLQQHVIPTDDDLLADYLGNATGFEEDDVFGDDVEDASR